MAASVSSGSCRTTLDAGLNFLARNQLPSGEFRTVVGPAPDLVDSISFTTSPYITSYVAHALSYIPESTVSTRIQERIADFLEAEEEPDGSWNFLGRKSWRIPADVDTTCCAAAALLVSGRRQPPSFYRLLFQVIRPTEAAAGGPYYSYLGVNKRPVNPVFALFTQELDVMVNLSVVFLCGLLDISVPGATDFLLRHLRHGSFEGQDRYYVSSHFQAYTLTRAYADAGVHALEPAMPGILDRIRTGMGSPEDEISAFNLACVATSLLNLGQDDNVVRPYLEALLARQESDGGWPVWAAGAGFPRE